MATASSIIIVILTTMVTMVGRVKVMNHCQKLIDYGSGASLPSFPLDITSLDLPSH
ncbi:hypothetical protein SESBI_32178 [Sesbania bispinosa]|nr:hypothetical protein SESBI_32178 [Sesbania bispinosa]